MIHPEALPEYRQAPPSEWPELVAFAEDVMSADIDSTRRCRLMLEEVQTLDVERAGVNRYYSIGIALRGFAAVLHDPATRMPIAQEAAEIMSQEYRRRGNVGASRIAINAIRETPFSIAASGVIRQSRYACAPAERFLGNALHYCAGYESRFSASSDQCIKAMQCDTPNQANIETNAFKGATDIIKTVLGQLATELQQVPFYAELRHIFEYRSPQTIRELIPKTTIQRAANVHFNAFGHVGRALQLRDEKLYFANEAMPKETPQSPLTRTATLGCPARYIQGFMEDAVTTVVEGAALAPTL